MAEHVFGSVTTNSVEVDGAVSAKEIFLNCTGTLAAAVAAAGSSPKTIIYSTDQTISANIAIPANVELLPLNGAIINHGAYTISYAGSTARWPVAQIFNGTGAVTGLDESTPEYFGVNATPGTTDMTTAVQKAFASSDKVHLTGRYLVSASLTARDNQYIYGDGDTSCLLANADIEIIKSDTTTTSTGIFGANFFNFFIQSTVTGVKTKYDIHLRNAAKVSLVKVCVQSGHLDNQYSATNVGGIWLEKPVGSTNASYMNSVDDCLIQNNSVWFGAGVTDSSIRNSFIWGHVRQFAIRVGGGNIDITDNPGIITSQYNGGIWLDGAGVNQVRIVNNDFDGNPLLTLGDGIYAPGQTVAVSVTGNTIWHCGKNGINVTDPVGWSIAGNAFWKNNGLDGSYDDIRITGVAFGPNGNVVSGNSHVIDEARTNKGYAIREVNGGAAPYGNSYSANGVTGVGYADAKFLFSGQGWNRPYTSSMVTPEHDLTAFKVSKSGAAVASTGTVDLLIAPDFGDFVGTLYVSNTRSDYPLQSRQTAYTVIGRASDATFTVVATKDGSGGGATFTVTMPSDGLVRITNTYANATTVKVAFYGLQGY